MKSKISVRLMKSTDASIQGIRSSHRVVKYFENVVADDDLVLSFIKTRS